MPGDQTSTSDTPTTTGEPTALSGDAPVNDAPEALLVADASAADDAVVEHPMTIIGEIEDLLRLVGNAAVHEYQRIIQRLADLKNHPAVKDASE
ncbi:hypothetical protein B0G84_2346 [Paraburkholderia sp. BL8N3]|nr:hypothetical protein [Paraburkholderia sp. BL8N3]TCK43998.1 hypothetical protein B0G84_2346 [Paraburkholderia sp. BL8N3]